MTWLFKGNESDVVHIECSQDEKGDKFWCFTKSKWNVADMWLIFLDRATKEYPGLEKLLISLQAEPNFPPSWQDFPASISYFLLYFFIFNVLKFPFKIKKFLCKKLTIWPIFSRPDSTLSLSVPDCICNFLNQNRYYLSTSDENELNVCQLIQ